MTGTVVEVATGLDVLPANSNKQAWTPEQTALMASLGLKGTRNKRINGEWVKEEFEAPASIVEAFLHQCRTRRLDPFARQIYCIERGGKWGIEASIDGFRLQAERSGKYIGQTPPQWTDGSMTDVLVLHNGELVMIDGRPMTKKDYVWVDAWVSDKPPVAARVGILKEGFNEPVWGVASYSGYCPRDKDGNLKPTGQWQFNSANQLCKCAEMLGLRKAYPTELSGLYGAEEMDQATRVSSPQPSPRRSEPSVPAPTSIKAASGPSKDWGRLAEAAETLDELTAIANEAQAAGELRVVVGLNGDNDDGSAHTVMDVLRARKAELESVTPPMVDLPKTATGRRQWVREARLLKTRAEVQALYHEASAARPPVQVLEELEAIERSLPDPEAEAAPPVSDWPTADVPVSETEWVEGPNGEFIEKPAEP